MWPIMTKTGWRRIGTPLNAITTASLEPQNRGWFFTNDDVGKRKRIDFETEQVLRLTARRSSDD